MAAAEQTASHFTVEKSRVYLDGETYNNGEGFQGGTPDEAQARLWFDIFSRDHGRDGRIYAVELRSGDTIIDRVGPTMQAAERSMWRAVRERKSRAALAKATA